MNGLLYALYTTHGQPPLGLIGSHHRYRPAARFVVAPGYVVDIHRLFQSRSRLTLRKRSVVRLT